MFSGDVMRKIAAIAIAIFAVMSILLSTNAAAGPSKESSEDISEKLILRLLHQPTVSAVDTYYGERRQYWQQELLSVQKIPQSPYYEVIIQVETFCGAHNPPYGIEAIAFHVGISGGVQLVSFDHQDEQ